VFVGHKNNPFFDWPGNAKAEPLPAARFTLSWRLRNIWDHLDLSTDILLLLWQPVLEMKSV
jgi:hypothetical protein